MTDKRTPPGVLVAVLATAALAVAIAYFAVTTLLVPVQWGPFLIVSVLLLGLARTTAAGRAPGRVALLLVLVPVTGLSTFAVATTGDPAFLVGTVLGGVALVTLARSGERFES